MNRRGFLSAMLKAGVGAMILPGAGRVWNVLPSGIVAPWPSGDHSQQSNAAGD